MISSRLLIILLKMQYHKNSFLQSHPFIQPLSSKAIVFFVRHRLLGEGGNDGFVNKPKNMGHCEPACLPALPTGRQAGGR
ncbi:MAG: hypothetical protein ACHQD8_04305 [Chitinophagales bacterium]